MVDQGPGIPPALRAQAFTPFKPREDGDTGLGLGLAVARGFVSAMHGTVEIEDTPGGGTTVVIRLGLADVGGHRDDDRVGAVEEPPL